jgi:hypothetical protein
MSMKINTDIKVQKQNLRIASSLTILKRANVEIGHRPTYSFGWI